MLHSTAHAPSCYEIIEKVQASSIGNSAAQAAGRAVVTRSVKEGASAAPVDRRGALALLAAAWQVAQAGDARAAECELTAAPSGLQFCDVKVGEGDEAQAGTLIRAHYAGKLQSNGKQFDSSYSRGRPLTFRVGAGEVIKGWDMGILGTEGIPPMKEGGKRQLIIPAELGYGQRGAGGIIPPGAVLVFDVEYLGKATGRR